MRTQLLAVAVLVVPFAASPARAQDRRDDWSRPHVLLEASGGGGVQFGETDYLPAGTPGNYRHPLVLGFAVGGTAGLALDRHIALVANYEYSNAQSQRGDLMGVLDEVQGSIEYHTVALGVRLSAPLPFGWLQAELAGGFLFPFQTEIELTYGPALAQLPSPITGTGRRIDYYDVGFGGHGMIGYRLPLGDVLYMAANLKMRLFESENSGNRTELQNFVTDFAAPSPTTTTIHYGEGAATPSTYSVQDFRLHLAIGAEI
jgi:hypothetical protein